MYIPCVKKNNNNLLQYTPLQQNFNITKIPNIN